MLPPLSATAPPSSDNNNSDNNNRSPVASPSKSAAATVPTPRVEPLLINHVRFAYAFKKNDAAKILPFLHKDVALTTVDRTQLRGISAVLGYLVGPRMAKLSTHMHIKGAPTRLAGAAPSSKFVYDHGLLFRQPLYSEVIEWTAEHLVVTISHVAVSKVDSSGKNKATAVVAAALSAGGSLPHTSSSSSLLPSSSDTNNNNDNNNDEHEDPHVAENNNDVDTAALLSMEDVIRVRCAPSSSDASSAAASLGRRLSRSSSTDSSARLSVSSTTLDDVATSPLPSPLHHPKAAVAAAVLEIVELACVHLTPIRSRKRVNPFVTIRKHGKSHWKSSIARHAAQPVWTNVPIELHNAPCRSGLESPAHAILEISLWDFHLFKSVKVAAAAVVVADLFVVQAPTDELFTTRVQLERMNLNDTAPPIELALTLRYKQTAATGGAAADNHHQLRDAAAMQDASSTAVLEDDAHDRAAVSTDASASLAAAVCELRWYISNAAASRSTSMLLRGLFGVVLVLLVSQIDFERLRAANRTT